jgi:hypothetical protein
VDGIKGLLGVHSPSTVFAGIGSDMGEGIGVGFLKSMQEVERKIEGAIPTTFDLDTQITGLEPAFAGAAMTYNHTGSIRVEGVNNESELVGVVNIIIDQLRQEVRR